MKLAFSVLTMGVLVQHVSALYGGSISAYITKGSPGHIKVKAFFLNGWRTGKGPCRMCTTLDVGSNITDIKKQVINNSSNPAIFGKWTIEMQYAHYQRVDLDKNNVIRRTEKDVMLAVSEKEEWELDGTEFSFEISTTQYTDIRYVDIMFSDTIDTSLTLLPEISTIHLQVKSYPQVRSDTGKANRSPRVLVKPLYSLERGKNYKIHIESVDEDGDLVLCRESRFVEAFEIGPFMSTLMKRGFLFVDRRKCVVNITVDPSYFHEGDTFPVAITLEDYNRHPILLHTMSSGKDSLQNSYGYSLSGVVVKMIINITGRTDPPEFIPPTPSHGYTVYCGGDVQIKVYAKAAPGRNIVRFDFLRHNWRYVNHTGINDASHISANAVSTTITWSPSDDDIGYHIICVNAEDDQGRNTVNLVCFRIEVKENILRQESAMSGKPYFLYPTDLTCTKDTSCIFPVSISSLNSKGVVSVAITSETVENVTIQYRRELINDIMQITAARVEFLASQVGRRKICLNASDSMSSSDLCLFITVPFQDPCSVSPCKSGFCQAYDDNTGFRCRCRPGYTGNLCEINKKKTSPCSSNPCYGGANCIGVPSPPYYICFYIDKCGKHSCARNEMCYQGIPQNYTCSAISILKIS
ncbi:uncharacterized protein LOC134266665 [Saccostrea cucullata]|uniref:uncharacterized protein LOC134266665 n=1 Tax=Saccostrea cuccullata TaxID=36930 RepID=UPI002ECFBBA9